MKTFTTKEHGEFSATLANNTLSFHGTKLDSHFHYPVPDFMRAEAGRLYRRDSGDKLIDFAYLCMVHEAALEIWER